MALRTISRDDGGSQIKVWPKGIGVDDVKNSSTHAAMKLHYANDDNGNAITPAMIPADVFKNAFGFVPKTNTVGSYVLVKAERIEALADTLGGLVDAD